MDRCAAHMIFYPQNIIHELSLWYQCMDLILCPCAILVQWWMWVPVLALGCCWLFTFMEWHLCWVYLHCIADFWHGLCLFQDLWCVLLTNWFWNTLLPSWWSPPTSSFFREVQSWPELTLSTRRRIGVFVRIDAGRVVLSGGIGCIFCWRYFVSGVSFLSSSSMTKVLFGWACVWLVGFTL